MCPECKKREKIGKIIGYVVDIALAAAVFYAAVYLLRKGSIHYRPESQWPVSYTHLDVYKRQVQFCMAYCGVLAKHNICATGTTGKFVEEATGLKIDKCLAGMQGGEEQISARVAYNEIDLVLFFRDPMSNSQYEPDLHAIARLCDMHNIPVSYTHLGSCWR